MATRKRSRYIDHPGYNVEALLEFAMVTLKCKSHSKLAAYLGLDDGQMSRIRHKVDSLTPYVLLSIHELTGAPVKKLRAILGVPREDIDMHDNGYPAVAAQVSKMRRYFHAPGGMGIGAVGRNGYVSYPELMDLLEGKNVQLDNRDQAAAA